MTPVLLFSWEFCRFFKDTYLVEHLRMLVTVVLSLEVFLKLESIFKNTNKEMLLTLLILQIRREADTSSSIKKLTSFSKKMGNTHVMLGFVWSTY